MRIFTALALTLLIAFQQRPLSSIATDLEKLIVELRAALPTPAPPTTTTKTVVPVGATEAEIQALINAALPGATLVFQAGATYTGALTLPAKAGLVTITTSGALPNRRLTPADAPLLPILRSGNIGPVLDGTNAANWKIDGVQFESTRTGHGEILIFENASNITLDHLLIVAGVDGQKRAIRGNAKGITLARSHIANIWRTGQDSQAFCAWDGAGPYTITDNYLEAAGENIMFGGSDMATAAGIPSDILIERNTLRKQPAWRGQVGFAVKNLFELKVGRRGIVRFNEFDGNWRDAQNGYGILIKAINQDGRNPWNVTEDWLFEGNWLHNTENGINILGYDYGQPSGRVTRVTIRGNVIETAGVAFQFGGEIGDLALDQNVVENGYTFMSLYGGGVWPTSENRTGSRAAVYAVQRLTMTGNLSRHNEYGIKGDGTGWGTVALTAFAPGFVFTNNSLVGLLGTYPPTTQTITEANLQAAKAALLKALGR